MPDISLDEIETKTATALTRHGAVPPVAESVARAVRAAEAQGNVICGLYYVESYCLQLRSGRVKGTVEPKISQPKPAVLTVDARLGFAQPAFDAGIAPALRVMERQGTVTLAIRGAHTCTSLGYFTRRLAEAGAIALGFTNASAIVAPPGGRYRVLGTNPIAMHVPAPGGGIAFGFDQSTSAVALGKITMAKAAGEKIPPGWAVDAAGEPTTDPAAALAGSLVSTGGAKGWGFGLMAEVLASALTDTAASTEVAGLKLPDGPPHNLGQTYLLIHPTAVAGDGFHSRIAALSEAVARDKEARLPGARPKQMDPVAVPDALWDTVRRLAR
ncbi:MAG: Ldh family oxidoreductase [Pseudomonadota bacterium]